MEEERSNPLQYSCLRNPAGRGAWWVTAHGFAKNQTQPSMHTHGRLSIFYNKKDSSFQ